MDDKFFAVLVIIAIFAVAVMLGTTGTATG